LVETVLNGWQKNGSFGFLFVCLCVNGKHIVLFFGLVLIAGLFINFCMVVCSSVGRSNYLNKYISPFRFFIISAMLFPLFSITSILLLIFTQLILHAPYSFLIRLCRLIC